MNLKLILTAGLLVSSLNARGQNYLALTLMTGTRQIGFTNVAGAEQPVLLGTPTTVMFLDLDRLGPVGSIMTTECPAVARGPKQKYLIGYSHCYTDEPLCPDRRSTIVEYDPGQIHPIASQYEFPRILDHTDFTFGPLPGVSPMAVTSNGTIWMLTMEWQPDGKKILRIEALDWGSQQTKLSTELPKVVDVPRIFALGEGCLLTYLGSDKATLYLTDGRTLTCSLLIKPGLVGFFETGCGYGNKVWGLGRRDDLTCVDYSKEPEKLQATFQKLDLPEDKFFYPIEMTFNEKENVLVVTSGDGDQLIRLVRLIAPATGKVVKRFVMPAPADTVVYRDQKLYAVLDGETRITVYDASLKIIEQSRSFCPVINGVFLNR